MIIQDLNSAFDDVLYNNLVIQSKNTKAAIYSARFGNIDDLKWTGETNVVQDAAENGQTSVLEYLKTPFYKISFQSVALFGAMATIQYYETKIQDNSEIIDSILYGSASGNKMDIFR